MSSLDKIVLKADENEYEKGTPVGVEVAPQVVVMVMTTTEQALMRPSWPPWAQSRRFQASRTPTVMHVNDGLHVVYSMLG